MDGLIIIVLVKELWEKINLAAIVSLLVFITGAVSAVYLMYDRYRFDRRKLKMYDEDISEIKDEVINFKSKMETDFEQHKKDNTESYKEIVNMIHAGNEKFYEKIDAKNKEVKDDLTIATQRLYEHIDKRNEEVHSLLHEIRFSLMRKNNKGE